MDRRKADRGWGAVWPRARHCTSLSAPLGSGGSRLPGRAVGCEGGGVERVSKVPAAQQVLGEWQLRILSLLFPLRPCQYPTLQLYGSTGPVPKAFPKVASLPVAADLRVRSALLTLILQVGKLRHRAAKKLAWSHSVSGRGGI